MGSNAFWRARSRPIMELSAISAPARSIEAQARSISRLRMTSRIETWWTSTSYIDFSTESGSIPCDIVRLPCGSRSAQSTRCPSSERATARLSVVVVLATPPFWFANAMTLALFSTEGSAFSSGKPVRRTIRTCVMDSSMSHIAHWDDAPSARFDVGPMGADWDLLGSAVGCDRVGLRRIRISPGKQSTPVHAHFGEEEIFYVLRGSGYSFQEDGVYAIGEGDAVLHPHGGAAHTVVAGDDGIDVLAFGDDLRHEVVRFPRINAAWTGGMVFDFLPFHQFQ